MKTVYSVFAPFSGDPKVSADKAWILSWLWLSQYGLGEGTPPTSPPGRIAGDDGHELQWRETEFGDSAVKSLSHSVSSEDESSPHWRTQIWICRQGERSWGVLRAGPENPLGVITTLRYDAKRPRLISDWLADLEVVRDGRRLTELELRVGPDEVPPLVEYLLDPRRQLPVVGITNAVAGRPAVSPTNLAYKLAGNAIVVVIDRKASRALTDALSKPLTVFDGAVRLWWPRMTPGDDPYRHTLLMRDRIEQDPTRAERTIVSRIWRAAVDAIGVPTLEAQLRAEQNRQAVETRMAALGSEVRDAQEWSDLMTQELDAYGELKEQLDEAQAIADDLRDELERARTGQEPFEERDTEVEVQTVEEAVRLAAEESHYVVYLDSAYRSARESHYPDPNQVLHDLQSLERVANRWVEGNLTGGFEGAFAEEPVRYQSGIGQTAQTRFRSDYEIDYRGEKVLMGPHLRRGVGAPTAILRVYWYVDEKARHIVVGHVGAKLRDAGNN